MKTEPIKGKLVLEYDHEDYSSKQMMQRIMNADEAWNTLSKIQEEIRQHTKYEKPCVEVLTEINELINESGVNELWG